MTQANPTSSFGELRSLLQGPPSASRWEALWRWFERAQLQPHERSEALSYARDHLKRWPDLYRVASFCDPAPSTALESPLSLLKVLHLDALTSKAAQAWQDAPLEQLHALHLGADIAAIAGPRCGLFEAPMHLSDGPYLIKPGRLKALAALIQQRAWSSLRELWISGAALRLDDLEPLTLKPPSTMSWLERLEHLERLAMPYNSLRAEGCSWLSRLALPALRALNLTENELSPIALKALSRAPWWSQLRELEMSHNPSADALVELLTLDASPSRQLRALSLRSGALTASGLEQLVTLRSDQLSSLEHLDLLNNDLAEAPALMTLLAGTSSSSLKSLQLGRVQLGLDQLETLSRSMHWTHLEALGLRSSWLSIPGAELLAAASSFESLRVLDLGHCALGASGAEALSAAPWLNQLTRLSLGSNHIMASGLDALTQALPSRGPLTALDLAYNDLGDGGMFSIMDWPALSHVERLSLAYNKIGPRGARWLAKSDVLGSLEALDLRGNPLGLEGAIALSDAPWLSQLRELKLRSFDVTSPGLARLASVPQLQPQVRASLVARVRDEDQQPWPDDDKR